ncbi:hypothetical protein K4K52_006476 [Colletotrichum sp. SAR 10_76]|nr:hypothetical protein K4K52_006476 [Colletotrichum sp. SAR 10_76]
MEAVARNIVRRRIPRRRPRYQRDDLRIEIRDDSSDGEDSPSPDHSSFPPGVSKTHSPKTKTHSPKTTDPPPPPPPPVLAPANPTGTDETTTTSESITPSSAPSREPSREQPRPTSFPAASATPPSRTSSVPTALPESQFTTTKPTLAPTGGTTRGGNEIGLGDDRSSDAGWTPTAIAFGTIAIAALFLVIGWGLWWFLKYRKRREARRMYERSMSPDGHYWNPESTFSPSQQQPARRAPSSIMAELMGAAYAAENGSAGGGYHPDDRNSLTPQGYLDEKKYASGRQLPILEPAPVHQPNVRNSIASWIRRHHPLKLNPLSGRSSVYSSRTMGASAQSVNAPPVPNVPDAYRPDSQQAGNANRYTASSRYGTENQSDTNSILSLYENRQPPAAAGGQQGRPPQPLWLETPPPLMHGDRGVSMAPTEATESTWRSWGGGVNHPREQAPPPQTPRRGWIEKCIKFGGLK